MIVTYYINSWDRIEEFNSSNPDEVEEQTQKKKSISDLMRPTNN
jgi:hypothetical protein